MTTRTLTTIALVFIGGTAQAVGLADSPTGHSAGGWPLGSLDLAPHPTSPAASLTEERSQERSWYGYQLIISDLVSAGLLVAGAALVSDDCNILGHSSDGCGQGLAMGFAGTFGLLFVPAIIHGEHGQGGAAAASIALRIALPILGAVIAGLASHWSPGTDIGVAIGTGVGAIIDDAFLSSAAPRSPHG